LGNGTAAHKDVQWPASGGSPTLAITTTNGAQQTSAARTISFTPDASAPIGSFLTPADGALVLQTGTTFNVAWSQSDGGVGIASQSVQRQVAAVVSGHEGTCTGVNWTNDGKPTTTASPLTPTDLVSGNCYQWLLTLTDGLGNSATYTSGLLLIDSANPSLPDVAASGTGVHQAGPDGTVYFLPAAGGSVSLTATLTPVPPSGIASVTFDNLTATDGYVASPALPAADTNSPYSETLGFGAGTGSTSIDVHAVNGLGASSATRTVTMVPDTLAPVGDRPPGRSPSSGQRRTRPRPA
jgi:hypothetical protein